MSKTKNSDKKPILSAILSIRNIIFVFEILAFPIAIWALYETAKQSRLTQNAVELQIESSQAADIVSAWTLLSMRNPGNSGKVQALETLVSSGVPLRHINISCAAMSGGWTEASKSCAQPTVLVELDISASSTGKTVDLTGANLSGVEATEAQFSGAALKRADFSGAILAGSDFSQIKGYESVFSLAQIAGADFSGSDLNASDFSGATTPFIIAHARRTVVFKGVEMSEADFSNVFLQADFSSADLISTNFNSADLRNSDFQDADLAWVDFSEANLSKANLNGAALKK